MLIADLRSLSWDDIQIIHHQDNKIWFLNEKDENSNCFFDVFEYDIKKKKFQILNNKPFAGFYSRHRFHFEKEFLLISNLNYNGTEVLYLDFSTHQITSLFSLKGEFFIEFINSKYALAFDKSWESNPNLLPKAFLLDFSNNSMHVINNSYLYHDLYCEFWLFNSTFYFLYKEEGKENFISKIDFNKFVKQIKTNNELDFEIIFKSNSNIENIGLYQNNLHFLNVNSIIKINLEYEKFLKQDILNFDEYDDILYCFEKNLNLPKIWGINHKNSKTFICNLIKQDVNLSFDTSKGEFAGFIEDRYLITYKMLHDGNEPCFLTEILDIESQMLKLFKGIPMILDNKVILCE